MNPGFLTIPSAFGSPYAGLKAFGAGAALPPNLYLNSDRIQAAWLASTEWMEIAASSSEACAIHAIAPPNAAVPTGSIAADVAINVAWSVTALPKSNVGELTA